MSTKSVGWNVSIKFYDVQLNTTIFEHMGKIPLKLRIVSDFEKVYLVWARLICYKISENTIQLIWPLSQGLYKEAIQPLRRVTN